MNLIIKLGKLLFVLLLLQSCTAEKKEISLINRVVSLNSRGKLTNYVTKDKFSVI